MHGIDAHCPTDIVTAGCSKLRLVKSLYRPKVMPENVKYLNLKYFLCPIKHSKKSWNRLRVVPKFLKTFTASGYFIHNDTVDIRSKRLQFCEMMIATLYLGLGPVCKISSSEKRID